MRLRFEPFRRDRRLPRRLCPPSLRAVPSSELTRLITSIDSPAPGSAASAGVRACSAATAGFGMKDALAGSTRSSETLRMGLGTKTSASFSTLAYPSPCSASAIWLRTVSQASCQPVPLRARCARDAAFRTPTCSLSASKRDILLGSGSVVVHFVRRLSA